MDKNASKRTRIALWSVLLWLVVWEAASHLIGHDIILVSPLKVIVRLGELALLPSFWLTIASSFMRIIAGFLVAVIVGILLAVASARFRRIEELVTPPLLFIKATPVASFIILILIWIRPAQLSLVISFLIVLPLIYSNVLEGIRTTSLQLLEMAQVFRLPASRVVRFIHLPHVMPFFSAACSVALGLCWKAGIAAEIIGIPQDSIGERLYLAKLYLSTTDIFAWTVVIVLVSFLFEKVFLGALARLTRRVEQAQPKQRPTAKLAGQAADIPPACTGEPIVIASLSKSFKEQCVLCDFSCQIEPGGVTCLIAPSGWGKSTLLAILLGLGMCDAGCIQGVKGKRLSAVFQEDRLCENISGLTNCLITARHGVGSEDVATELGALGLDDHIHKPVRDLSGGMRRRVALARALLAPHDILILDEPFKGLDDELKKTVMAHVAQATKGTTVLLVTHDKREAQALDATIVDLTGRLS